MCKWTRRKTLWLCVREGPSGQVYWARQRERERERERESGGGGGGSYQTELRLQLDLHGLHGSPQLVDLSLGRLEDFCAGGHLLVELVELG